ncbi:hypothetical protein [Marinimicrobium sp. ABcell2]|uniref:hypothetical protein n=1 Tax=Marinimicrobium sp. ABcell2 TaxID=3069751 RepID=UPI0027B1BEC5|nr:hypothetical protein [Marinimicrobium sp. ABcell2]MDQ2078322.1 hypothetical protein [Marinimicrobium sp. ABcell2]
MNLHRVRELNRARKFSEVLSIIDNKDALNSIELATERAYALRLTKRLHEAEELLTSFPWQSEKNTKFLKELGHLFVCMKKFVEASELLDRLINFYGFESPSVYVDFIKTSLAMGRSESANQSLTYAVKKWPENKKILDCYQYFVPSTKPKPPPVDHGYPGDFLKKVCDFLYFGYLPSTYNARKHASYFEEILADDTLEVFDPDNPASMRLMLETIIKENVDRSGSECFRVGVSSGYDSRLILSALSNVVDSNRIFPFTIGTRGNKDITLAPVLIGQYFKHYRCQITDEIAGASIDVQDSASDYVEGMTFDAKVAKRSVKSTGSSSDSTKTDHESLRMKGAPNFNGFMGDPLSSSHLPKISSNSFSAAKEYHARKFSQYIKGDVKNGIAYDAGILPAWYKPSESLANEPLLDQDILSYDDQLDIFYRTYQYIRLLAPQGWTEWELAKFPQAIRDRLVARRDRMILPFNDPRWIRSCLLTPLGLRREQKFYKNFAAEAYPEYFQDLVNPKILNGYDLSGATNMDWGYLWLNIPEFKLSVMNVLASLKARDLWFDPFVAVEFANSRVKGYPALLKGLCALELNLRAGTIK